MGWNSWEYCRGWLPVELGTPCREKSLPSSLWWIGIIPFFLTCTQAQTDPISKIRNNNLVGRMINRKSWEAAPSKSGGKDNSHLKEPKDENVVESQSCLGWESSQRSSSPNVSVSQSATFPNLLNLLGMWFHPCPGQPVQGWTTLSMKKTFPKSTPNLPWHNLGLFPLILFLAPTPTWLHPPSLSVTEP